MADEIDFIPEPQSSDAIDFQPEVSTDKEPTVEDSTETQRQDLAAQKKQLQRERFIGEQEQAALGAAENIAKMASIPANPILKLPRSTGTGFGAGLANVGAGVAEGITAPAYWMIPGSKVVQALTAGQMAGNLPQSIPNAVRTIINPLATTAEKVESGAQPLLEAIVAGGLARSKSTESPLEAQEATPDALLSPKAPEVANEPETPPAASTGEALQPAPSEVTAKFGEVAPSPTEPTKVEGATPQPVPPVDTVTPTVTEGVGLGMGGALKEGEIPETGAGGEKYGVAERVRAERAQAGQVEPVEPGTGTSPEDQVLKYREIVAADPTAGPKALEAFEADPKKQISAELEGVTRAHGEALFSEARKLEGQFGTDSQEYRDAYQVASDWDKRTKPIQTEWSEIGRGQQGETDLDTGSFTGLRREREKSGKDFTPEQKPKAERIAGENRVAQGEVEKASVKLTSRIRQKAVPNAERRAIDAANKTVREADVRMANAENRQRVADVELKQATEQVQKDAEQKALDAANKTNRSAAKLKADAENNARLDRAAQEKKFAEADRKVAEKARAIADKAVRDAAVAAAREEQRRQADPSIAVWEAANKYLDQNKGLYGFDDIRNKIATDLGMSPERVTRIMSQDSVTKSLAVDLWNKQRNARRLKEQAKNWLRDLDTPGYLKALSSLPRFMFSLSVGGHGFVALGTHAPIVAFQPRYWTAYVRNFGKMYKQVFSPAYYEGQMADLVRRDNYEVARRAGLQNDPFKYEEFHTGELSRLVRDWVGESKMNKVDKFLSAGNRGYGILKVLRQDMFDQQWNKLPDSIKNEPGVAQGISDGVNHATGVTKKSAPKGANIALFAPRLAGSRVMWLGGDPVRASKTVANWKNASAAERQFAVAQMKEKAWVFGTFATLLAANQGVLSLIPGNKQKINGIPESLGGAGFDPLASDFMKFKIAGANIAYGGALLTMAKLPLRVATAILYDGKGSKYVLEDERVDKVVGQYIRSQMSPFTGTLSDLSLGRDYEERPLPAKVFGTVEQTGKVPKRLQKQGIDEPYNWAEYTATKLPIPVAEGIKEGLRSAGMSDTQITSWLKSLAVTSFMTGTGTRLTEDTRD